MIETKPTTNGHAPPTSRTPAGAAADQRTMSTHRKTAFAAGALYLLSFVSIPTLFLYNPLRASNYILGHGSNTGIIVGAILAGVACILSLVTLRQAGAGTDALVTGHALVAMYDRIFLLSQSFIPAVNALLIGSLLYQSRLVPRALPLLGFTGAALLVTGDVAVLFGLIGQHASTTGLFAIPIAVWEFSLGVYLVVKGFRPSAITALYNRTVGADNASMVPVEAAR